MADNKKPLAIDLKLCEARHNNPAMQDFLAKYRNNKVPVTYHEGSQRIRTEI